MATKKFCVIGLGYFGLNLALSLSEQGAEVLAVDISLDRVELLKDRVTHSVAMDTTDAKALRSLGLKDMDAVIVAIGEEFESSITTTALLQEIGVQKIYNRITSSIHERLLKLMNIEELLVPEAEAAEHLTKRLMIPGVIECLTIANEFGIYEITAPKLFVGQKLIDIGLREKYSLNLVTIKRTKHKSGLLSLGEREKVFVIGIPKPDTVIMEDDILVLFGHEKYIKNILELDE
jgi:trk system potassium uptake protein TrkA